MRNLLSLLFILSSVVGQINDKNFKSEINGGVVVAVFTSEWQEQPFDKDIVKGVSGYQDCEIIYVKSEDAKKVGKKLRLRNYPSIALFINGDKIDTWKGDMDGVIEIEPSDIKDAIENALAGDQY